MNPVKNEVELNGFAVVPACISEATLNVLSEAVDAHDHGTRNLLCNPVIRLFAKSDEVRDPVMSVLGDHCFAVRGIFFNKNASANWKVTWHQDCVIAVHEKVAIEGWGPWSLKANVTHVRPKTSIMEQMLSIRIHLDDCGDGNGPLRVLPGTHTVGFLSDSQIQNWPKEASVTCAVHRGDAVLMRPMLLHASSPAALPSNRRVIHLEFASSEPPGGARWHDRVPSL